MEYQKLEMKSDMILKVIDSEVTRNGKEKRQITAFV